MSIALLVTFWNRAYAESNWCMHEFHCARAHAISINKNNFLVPVLRGDVSLEDVNEELKFYFQSYTYLEPCEWVGVINANIFLQISN